MDEELRYRKEYNRKEFFRLRNDDGTPNYILLAIVGVIVLVVLFVVWWVVSEIQMANSKMTRVDNLPHYASEMSERSKDSVYATLYTAIQTNLPEGERPPYKGANVREGTYVEEEVDSTDSEEIYKSEFIVDIARLRQSYRVSLEWPVGDPTVFTTYYPEVTCVNGDEVIYEDFVCEDPPAMFPGDKSNPVRYLPHTVTDVEIGEAKYSVELDGDWLVISMQSCGDEKKREEYQKEADSWLESTEMDLEKYKRRYIETCDGNF